MLMKYNKIFFIFYKSVSFYLINNGNANDKKILKNFRIKEIIWYTINPTKIKFPTIS